MKRSYKLYLVFILFFLNHLAFAQNPYQSLGIETKVLTLSNGKYQEHFPNDTIVRIGSVLLNAITGQVVSFVEEDSSNISISPEVMNRFLSLDPLAIEFPEWSPYNYTFNNPILYIDPTGKAPVPPDDFIVNARGVVVERIKTDQPHRILTEQGETLYSNDPSTDVQEMELYDVGDQMVQFISDNEINDMMNVRGAGSGEGNLFTNSFGKFDFVYSELKANYSNEFMQEAERRRGVGLGRGGFVETGGFFVFGAKKKHGDRRKVYNMHDAGNFLWGFANKREGHSAKKLLWGANLNELFNFRWGDTNADMQAILDGHSHEEDTKKEENE